MWIVFYVEFISLSFDRFDGRVVAKLPFTPFGLLQGISHRNLMGTDMTDCSFIFLYILCTMSIREVRERERERGVIRVGLCKTNAVN